MKPSIKEAWTESGWGKRFFLVAFAALAVFCFVRHDGDDVSLGVIAVSLMLWQWNDMLQSVELKRWRNTFGAQAVTVNVHGDTDAGLRKAQQIAELRKIQHFSRD